MEHMEMCVKSNSICEINNRYREAPEVISKTENFGLKKREVGENISLEKAQELVEEAHNKSASQILELSGKYLTTEGKTRLEKGADVIRAVP